MKTIKKNTIGNYIEAEGHASHVRRAIVLEDKEVNHPDDSIKVRLLPGNEVTSIPFHAFQIIDTTPAYDIAVTEMEPIPPGKNPYNFDHVRTGVGLVAGVEAMWHTPMPGENLKELVLVNTRTGRRIKINLSNL